MNQDERGPRERAYDEHINPLITKVIEACKAHGIPLVCAFELDRGADGEYLHCTTAVTRDEDGPHIQHVARAAIEGPRASVLALTLTKRATD